VVGLLLRGQIDLCPFSVFELEVLNEIGERSGEDLAYSPCVFAKYPESLTVLSFSSPKSVTVNKFLKVGYC
jgi:hypothetical protein